VLALSTCAAARAQKSTPQGKLSKSCANAHNAGKKDWFFSNFAESIKIPLGY
jgi:hypothetical protein